ncbi:MAG: HAD family phosphatase [Magnetococcales bacterium]|nr:HAD family phosphatase [Magnetococcales bacterium]
MNRALLLDLDGTLADSMGVMRDSYRQFLHAHGRQDSDAEFQRLVGPPLEQVIADLKRTHSLKPNVATLLKQYLDLVHTVFDTVEPMPGAETLLKRAKNHDWAVGIVTSSTQPLTHRWISRTGLASMIDLIIGGGDVEHGKPDPEPYLLALKRLNISSDNALAVEDSRSGAQAAVAAEIRTFVLGNPTGCGCGEWPIVAGYIQRLDQLCNRIQ